MSDEAASDPQASDASRELPTEPGVWFHNQRACIVSKHPDSGEFIAQWPIEPTGVATCYMLPRGGWHKASPAVAGGETERLPSERTDSEHLAWIRTKLGLPPDAQMFSGHPTIAGAMHVVCSNADGYTRYIASYKCDDKQGEIARQSVEIERLRARVAELEGR